MFCITVRTGKSNACKIKFRFFLSLTHSKQLVCSEKKILFGFGLLSKCVNGQSEMYAKTGVGKVIDCFS